MIEQGQKLTLTAIANLAEVGVSAASNWRKRHSDFPRAVLVSGQETFAADQVADWLDRRKIARNSLQPGEKPGTTYGDRFRRNGGVPALAARAEPEQIQTELRSDWTHQLWQIMGLLRGDLETATARNFIMGLLYVRVTNPDLWREVTEQSSWDAVSRILRRVSLSEYDDPIFPTVPSDLSGERHLVEVIRLLNQMDLDGTGSASVFDELLDRMTRDLGTRGGHFTPPSVAKCLVEVLNPRSTDTVFDPSCGSGELLVAAAKRGAGSVCGQAMNRHSLWMASLNLAVHGHEADLRSGGPEIINGAFGSQQFDVILSNPPFGIMLPDSVEHDAWPFGIPNKRSSFAWLQIAVHGLKPGGRAGVLMPNGTLFAGGSNETIRRGMVDAGVVECIIALPAGLFADTGIPVALWLLRRPESGESAPSQILFIDASRMGTTKGRIQRVLYDDEVAGIAATYRDWIDRGRLETPERSAGTSRSVAIEEVRRNDYDLQPQHYVPSPLTAPPQASLESVQRDLDELAQSVKLARRDVDAHLAALRDTAAREWQEVSLGDICNVQVGPGTVDRTRGLTVQGWTPLVLPRNIRRGHLSHDELDTVAHETSAKLANYRLLSGDLVCARSGTLGRHGLVREAEDGWLLGPSCMRLRPSREEVVPEYLVHHLNSPRVHMWITSKAQGSTAIPHISATTMRDLVVPLPPIPVQRAVAAAMDSINVLIERQQQGAERMQALRDAVFASMTQS